MKDKTLVQQLKTLTSIPSISGYEEEMAAYLQTQLVGKVKVLTDTKGNLIVQKGKHPEKLALIAHMDKEGFLVIGKGKNYVEVIPTRVRTWEEGILGQAVGIDMHKKAHKGQLEHNKNFGMNTFRFFVSTPKKFEVGNPIALITDFLIKDNVVQSAHLDNSFGVLTILHVFNNISEGTVIFSAVEEVGFHGAGPAVYQVKPEKILVVDTTYDTEKGGGARLFSGKGPSICIKDAVFGDKAMIQNLRKIAEVQKIPYQLELWVTANSDMLAVHNLFSGIPATFIGLPIKNQTTTREIGSLSDVSNAIKLLTIYAKSL